MKHFLALFALGLGLAPAMGQPPTQPADMLTIKLTIRPAKAPVPALKYQLLPEVRDRRPGNAAFLYYRAFSSEWASTLQRPEVSRLLERWGEDPRKPPGKEARWVLTFAALKEIDRGARRAYLDWELTGQLRKEGIGLLLPDLQGFRQYASLLAMRARLEMADGHLDRAAYSLQTGFAFGRDVGKGPTLLHGLVGMAMTTLTLEQVEEFIQTPGAPNLYWALTELPAPFIDMRTGYQGERLFMDTFFPGVREMLRDPKARPMSRAEARALVDRVAGEMERYKLAPSYYNWEGRLGLAVLAAQSYPEARRFLLAQGRSPEVVEAMPLLQAVVMLEVHNFDRFFDDMVKWTALPYWQARPGLKQAVEELRQAKACAGGKGTLLATLLLPAMEKVQQASVRTDRRIAALRCVEALRLYAAAHDGKLPARLDDVKAVPVPVDPVSGKAFAYTVAGNRAVLYGGPPEGEKASLNNSLRYELTLRP